VVCVQCPYSGQLFKISSSFLRVWYIRLDRLEKKNHHYPRGCVKKKSILKIFTTNTHNTAIPQSLFILTKQTQTNTNKHKQTQTQTNTNKHKQTQTNTNTNKHKQTQTKQIKTNTNKIN